MSGPVTPDQLTVQQVYISTRSLEKGMRFLWEKHIGPRLRAILSNRTRSQMLSYIRLLQP